ncbi:MAG: hypothetical protein WC518_00780 [Patescibacteria group bacterium]
MIFFKLHELIWVNPAKRDKVILINLSLALLINLALIAALIFNFWWAKEFIILRFNIYFGISSLGAWYKVFLMPLIGLIIIVVNFLLSFYFYLKEKLLSYYLAAAALVCNLILLVAGALLIYINL